MGIKTGLEQALNNVAPDGEAWTAGWDEFFTQLGEADATIPEALERALITANGGRNLPPSWMSASKGRFWRFARQSVPPQEEAPEEASNEEGTPEE